MNSKIRFLRHVLTMALLVGLLLISLASHTSAADKDLAWPAITRTQKPWAFWWWMGSAVDEKNITRELVRYRDAGMGGVHIIPIYGAKGWETNYIPYLNPRWMQMMGYAVREADRLGMGVDMTTGTGWCFGGPRVSDQEANANVVVKTYDLAAGERLKEKFDRVTTQALVAFSPDGKLMDLTKDISTEGEVAFSPPSGAWKVYAISQKPSGQKVKRPSPGGEGWMLNLFYPEAMTNYLRWFDEAFAKYKGPKPRAQYHDSYEYRSDWSPDFFAQFEKRRGYRLQDELPALFATSKDERTGRVLCDYRETISDLMADTTLPMWTKWSHDHGFITRDQAHGSPGNLLDLYATADVPETEMFHLDRNKLISKFASSAAHVAGHPLTSSETGTWLEEHFTETLGDMKFLQDDLFLSGVNHIFYHGTCYSPDEAGWPGWHFYASYEMNPRNSVWRDVATLNAYAARCQAVLQSGKPDNDILLYWPIHDFWSQPGSNLLSAMTVHARAWFESQPIGKTAEELWKRGYQFDYASDRQLAAASVVNGKVQVAGGKYGVIVVPKCQVMSLATMGKLLALAKAGATIIFAEALPADVSGWAKLDEQRTKFTQLKAEAATMAMLKSANKHNHVLVGDLEANLTTAGIQRESLSDHPGLMCIRRAVDGGRYYFIANRGEQALDGLVPLAANAKSMVLLDPLSGRTGVATSQPGSNGETKVRLQLAPGESVVVRTLETRTATGPAWNYLQTTGSSSMVGGPWRVDFLSGGPVLPPPIQTSQPVSWTQIGVEDTRRFAGTARYSTTFDAPASATKEWLLDLGKVCQSARVRLNGRDLGTVITPPFRVAVKGLKARKNRLEVEVTSTDANRIRDLDQRGVKWKTFHDINFVNLNYKPFDASNWPVADAGLLGPVTLTPTSAQ